MSRRRSSRSAADLATGPDLCACSRPTRDGAFVCDQCREQLATDLAALLDTPRLDRPTTPTTRHSEYRDRFPTADGTPGLLVSVPVTACVWPRPLEVDPGLWSELLSVLAGERGIDYRSLGGGSGAAPAPRVDATDPADPADPAASTSTDLDTDERRPGVPTGIVLHERASTVMTDLLLALRDTVMACMAGRVEHTAPAETQPLSVPPSHGPRSRSSLVPDMASWLLWRVDGLALHPEGPDAVRRVHAAVEAARSVIHPPQPPQDLGPCLVDGCDGRLLAPRDRPHATCDTCGTAFEASQVRDWLIGELEDRLCTAAEVAHLSTYLAMSTTRDRVRWRVNQWARRGQIVDPRVEPWPPTAHTPVHAAGPRYRFGDIYTLLLDHEARRTTTHHEEP